MTFIEDFSFLHGKEERKLSKGLAAFRRLLSSIDEEKRQKLLLLTRRLSELGDQFEFNLSNVAITLHVVEPDRDGEPLDFAVPPNILQLAIEQWDAGDLLVPDGLDLHGELHNSYGAKEGA